MTAQEAPAGPSTCDAIAAHAAQTSAKVQDLAAAAKIAAAEANLPTWETPQLRAGFDVADPDEQVQLGLRWRPPVPGLGAAMTAAHEAHAAELTAQAQHMAVTAALDARLAHLAVRRAEAELALLSDLTALAEVDHRRIQGLQAAGSATRLTVAKSRLDGQRLRLKAARINAELDDAKSVLQRLSGSTTATGKCTFDSHQSAADSPAVAAAAAARRATHASAFADQREAWFWPDFVELKWDDVGETNDAVLFQVGISLDALQTGRSTLAARRVEAADLGLENTQRVHHAEWTAAKLRVKAAEKRHEQATALLAESRDDAALLAAAREARSDASEIADLEKAALETRYAIQEAAFDLEAAQIQLQAASGRP